MSQLRTARIGLLVWACLLACRLAAGQAVDPSEPKWTDEQKSHWSFRPVLRGPMPQVKMQKWVKTPIDSFVLSSIEDAGLKPAKEADRLTLIRRLTFDLTGLPPTPEEVDAFVADSRTDAYERLVDRLLASTAYGERWARPWLDLARFAESDGFKSDKTRPNAWRYRDWVINALNADLPYDKFVLYQLAGDEIAPNDPNAFIATGFNRGYPFEDNNMVPGLNQQLMLDDLTDTTASVFLGLTVACARCHNHKYDPISQKDYYRIQAMFGAAVPRDDFTLAPPFERALHAAVEAEHLARVGRLKKEIDAIELPYKSKLLGAAMKKLPPEVLVAFDKNPIQRTAAEEDLLKKHAKQMAVEPKAMQAAMSTVDRVNWTARTSVMTVLAKSGPTSLDSASGMTDVSGQAPPVYLRRKGNFKNPGSVVEPGLLSVLNETSTTPDIKSTPAGTSGRRKALADWIINPSNPLASRVIVNRLWHEHFGRGIVTTPSDFGVQGAEPTHPELLDWLASELVAQGWSLKAMHRLMVTSAVYRQSSNSDAATIEQDPENTTFARMPRRRLEAEAVRDNMLMVSGRLDRRIGGPSVFPDLPPGIETRGGWTRSDNAADRNRRSVYVFVRRNLKYPIFDAFDFPDTNLTCSERNTSVNAPQALMLLNSDLVLDEARAFAGRLYASAKNRSDLTSLVRDSYRLAFGRQPDREEIERSLAFLRDQPARLSGRSTGKAASLPVPIPDGVSPVQAAAFVDYCHALLNVNEFVFVD